MADKKSKKNQYTIQGVEFQLKPIKVGQIRKALRLVGDVEFDESKASEMIDKLLGDKLAELAFILFGEDARKVDWNNVEYDQIDRIVSDFLQLNPMLKKRLSALFGVSA